MVDSCQALKRHQLDYGTGLAEAQELFEDEQLFFRRHHQPAVQHLPTRKLEGSSTQSEGTKPENRFQTLCRFPINTKLQFNTAALESHDPTSGAARQVLFQL